MDGSYGPCAKINVYLGRAGYGLCHFGVYEGFLSPIQGTSVAPAGFPLQAYAHLLHSSGY